MKIFKRNPLASNVGVALISWIIFTAATIGVVAGGAYSLIKIYRAEIAQPNKLIEEINKLKAENEKLKQLSDSTNKKIEIVNYDMEELIQKIQKSEIETKFISERLRKLTAGQNSTSAKDGGGVIERLQLNSDLLRNAWDRNQPRTRRTKR